MMIRVTVVWTCPNCGRPFGKKNQGHTCSPGMSEEQYFATGPDFERPIYDEVAPFITALGPAIVEFVQVGVFFKAKRTFAELRPLTKWVNLTFHLGRELKHPQIQKGMNYAPGRWYYTVRLKTPEDVTEDVLGWLAESWEFCS